MCRDEYMSIIIMSIVLWDLIHMGENSKLFNVPKLSVSARKETQLSEIINNNKNEASLKVILCFVTVGHSDKLCIIFQNQGLC